MRTERFEVTTDHIKLLRRAYVSWDDGEFGAPAIDCKRPYGNSSVYEDIVEICGFDFQQDPYDDYYAADVAFMDRLHEGTKNALQIFLQTGKMETGIYERELYGGDWKRVGGIKRKV